MVFKKGDNKLIKEKSKFDEQFSLIDSSQDLDYNVSEKVPWGWLVANQIQRITNIINTTGRQTPLRLRDSIDVLYTYILKDADQSPSFQDNMKKLRDWRINQLKGLPPQTKAAKDAAIEFQYCMIKFRFIMRLMDEKGYFGNKII